MQKLGTRLLSFISGIYFEFSVKCTRMSGPAEKPLLGQLHHPLFLFLNDGPHFSKLFVSVVLLSAIAYRLLVISFCEVDVGVFVYSRSFGCVDCSVL